MMDNTQFDLNCTNLTLPQVIAQSNARSVSAMVFFVLTVGILAVLVFYKAYNSTLQRFFIYLTVVTIIQLGAIAMNIELQFDVTHGDTFCILLAFVDQWTAVMLYLFAFAISVLLLCTICSQLYFARSNQPGCFQFFLQHRITLEIVISVVIIIIPVTFLWMPFEKGTYGHSPAGVSCWMKLLNENCTEVEYGLRDQIVFGFGIFHLISIGIIVIFFVLAVMFCRYAYMYRLTRRHHLKTLCQTLLLLSFMLVSVMIEAVGLVIQIYSLITTKIEIPYWFSVAYNAAIPFSQFVVPLGFMAYLYSSKKFKWDNVKRTAREWRHLFRCCRCSCECCYHCMRTNSSAPEMYEHLPDADVVEKATAPESTRVSLPSDTFFNVRYTGEFTGISQPVISSQQDTGYGSVV